MKFLESLGAFLTLIVIIALCALTAIIGEALS